MPDARRKYVTAFATLLIVGLVQFPLRAQSPAPALFYSDLTDGPRTGGENNKGAYVCVYGRNFGSTRGTSTITVGGVAAANYPVWGDGNASARGDSKACFQLGSSVPTGPQALQMTVNGQTSNTVPFYVRADAADAIYCVSDVALPTGSTAPSDSNSGRFGACWATVGKAQTSMTTSSIIYLHNVSRTSVSGCSQGSFSWCPTVGGTANANTALTTYPGSTATIGKYTWDGNALTYGIKLATAATNYTTIANLQIRGSSFAIQGIGLVPTAAGSKYNRIVANDMSCSASNGQSGCATSSFTRGYKWLGNKLHDIGLYEPHGYMQGALPSGPLDATDSVVLSIVSNGSACTINTRNDPASGIGAMWVGMIVFVMNGPGGLHGIWSSVSSFGANSFVLPCSAAAGTYTSADYPRFWYTRRDKQYHSMYLTTDNTDYEVAYNEWANNYSNNDFDTNSSPLDMPNPNNGSAGGQWGVPQPLLPTDLPQNGGYPVLGTTAGCVSGACTGGRTVYTAMSWQGHGGETVPSHSTAYTVGANQRVTMASPPAMVSGQVTTQYFATTSCGALCTPTAWCVYAGSSPSTLKQQACMAVGTNWTEPTTSITSSGSSPLTWDTQTAAEFSGNSSTHLFIHHNLMHGGATQGMSMNNCDPTPTGLYGDDDTPGGCYVYDNVIYNQGLTYFTQSVGLFSSNDSGSQTCILIGAVDQNGPTHAGTYKVENNTCYNVGHYWSGHVGFLGMGSIAPVNCKETLSANNNLFVTPSPVTTLQQPFIDTTMYSGSACANSYTGQKNVWWNAAGGAASAPPDASAANGDSSCVSGGTNVGKTCFTNNITADPLFVNPGAGDFHLQSASPAKSGSVATFATTDFYGVPRGQNGSYAIGAFELAGGSIISSVYDVNGDGVVDQKDVDGAVTQLEGACGNGDVNHDGVCNILDVQAIINVVRAGPSN